VIGGERVKRDVLLDSSEQRAVAKPLGRGFGKFNPTGLQFHFFSRYSAIEQVLCLSTPFSSVFCYVNNPSCILFDNLYDNIYSP